MDFAIRPNLKAMTNHIKKGYQHIWLPYTQMKNHPNQLEVVSAQGVKLKLKNGEELIDGISSWWSVAHGYNHPKIVQALIKQSKTLPHIMMAGIANQQTYKLAVNLAKITPDGLNKVFFSDSGSTAIEVAMKMAVQFHINKSYGKINNKKNKFICFNNSYHGDTTGAMSLSDIKSGMHHKFSSFLLKNYHLQMPFDSKSILQLENFIQKHCLNIAGIIIEPLVQCAGGMKFHSPEILKAIYDLAKKYEVIFIADECATGFYRTGKYFACNYANITPDIMILGKALTGGYITLATTITTDEIFNQFLGDDQSFTFIHGPTFMGNPLACAAANASIELFAQNDYQIKVAEISQILNQELEKCRTIKMVKDIRVLGAIAAIEINLSRQEILELRANFIKEGVWLRPFGNVIYVMPPLIIEKSDLIKITDAIFKLLINLIK